MPAANRRSRLNQQHKPAVKRIRTKRTARGFVVGFLIRLLIFDRDFLRRIAVWKLVGHHDRPGRGDHALDRGTADTDEVRIDDGRRAINFLGVTAFAERNEGEARPAAPDPPVITASGAAAMIRSACAVTEVSARANRSLVRISIAGVIFAGRRKRGSPQPSL